MNYKSQKKKELRGLIRLAVGNLSADEKRFKSQKVCDLLEHHPSFLSARSVLAFWPLPDEVDIRPFIERNSKYKDFYLPVVEGDNLLIKRYTDQKSVGAYNILEPVGVETFSIHDIDLVIVPGVAFDTNGCRLGRGKGYYDRLLSTENVNTLGVCFREQIVEYIDTEEHDKSVLNVVYF